MKHYGLRWLVLLVLSCVLCFGCAKKPVATDAQNQEISQAEKDRLAHERQLAEEERLRQQRQMDAALAQKVQTLESNRIYFAFDSFELNPQARTILQDKAQLLKQAPSLKMRIEGHCDERGTDEYNLALGEKRARVAYEFLVLLGVEPQRLQIISYGEEYPADPGHTEAAWSLNRRDEFRVFR